MLPQLCCKSPGSRAGTSTGTRKTPWDRSCRQKRHHLRRSPLRRRSATFRPGTEQKSLSALVCSLPRPYLTYMCPGCKECSSSGRSAPGTCQLGSLNKSSSRSHFGRCPLGKRRTTPLLLTKRWQCPLRRVSRPHCRRARRLANSFPHRTGDSSFAQVTAGRGRRRRASRSFGPCSTCSCPQRMGSM